MKRHDLHLASASPRRSDILTSLGLSFSVAGTDIDESRIARESVSDMVLRLAAAKAEAAEVPGNTPSPVLGADTTVVLDG